jgi:cytochrome c-type biogenesis protein CcmH
MVFLSVFMGVTTVSGSFINSGDMLENPALEARARALEKEIRCIVCDSEPISTSDAPLARGMRLYVRDMMVRGHTDDEILGALVERYGDYVRFRPSTKGWIGIVWVLPGIIFLIGAKIVFSFIKKGSRLTQTRSDLS